MKFATALAALTGLCSLGTALAQTGPNSAVSTNGTVKRVLLISIDGMHAADLENCTKGISSVNHGETYCPTLATLKHNGLNYVAASTSKPRLSR